mgnify:CR=1 FL=1
MTIYAPAGSGALPLAGVLLFNSGTANSLSSGRAATARLTPRVEGGTRRNSSVSPGACDDCSDRRRGLVRLLLEVLLLTPEELASALNDRRSLQRMFFDGQEQWLDTLVPLDDPAFTAIGRLHCSAVHG